MSEKYYEQDLARFKEEYVNSEFVPFPTVQEAIEALTETASSTLDGDEFLADVYEALGKEIQERRMAFIDEYIGTKEASE